MEKSIRSLSRKFFWILLAGVVFFFGLLTFIIIKRETSLIREIYIQHSSGEAQVLYSQLKELMFKGESKEIMRYIETASRGYSAVIIVTGPEGNSAFGTTADRSLKPPDPQEQATWRMGRDLVFYMPLQNEKRCHSCHNALDKTRGAIVIKHSMEGAEREIRKTAVQILLFAFFIGFTSEIFLIFILRASILKPIGILHRGAQILKNGQLDHRIGLQRNDEIGALAACFNTMAESIEKSHSQLETAVRRKTTELKVVAELSTRVFKGDLDFSLIAEQFLSAIKDNMGFSYAALCLVDKETGSLFPEFNKGIKDGLCIESISLAGNHPFIVSVREAVPSVKKAEEIGAPGIFGNVVIIPILSHQRKRCSEINVCSFNNCPAFSSSDERCWLISGTLCRSPQAVAEREKIYGCLLCPVFPVLGVLIAGRSGDITKSSLHSLEILASELSSAIENQRFIEAKENDINKLMNLHDISIDTLRGFGNPLSKNLASSAAAFSNTDAVILWLKGADGRLYPEDPFNVQDELIPESLDCADSFIGRAIRGEAIVETIDTEEVPCLSSVVKGRGFLYIGIVPLNFKDDTIGCFTLFKERDFLMTISEKAIVFLFASQAAAAINSAQIYEALRESEERYRGFIESAADVIFTLSPDGLLTSLNPSFETITGWERTGWIGKHFSELIHPGDLPLAREMFGRALRGGNPPTFEMRIRNKRGEYLIGEITEVPFEQRGRRIGILGIARDVTMRKKADDNLKKLMLELNAQKEFADAVFNNTSSGIMALDREGRLIRINKAGSEILGIAPQKALGKKSSDIDAALGNLNFISSNLDREITIMAGSGPEKVTEKPVGFSASPLLDSDGGVMGTVIVFRDLTDIKKLQQELRDREHYQAVGKVISGVAHEVRNPLFGISSIGQILERELTSDQHKTLIQAMLKEAGRMRRLIDELLLYTRPARLDIKEIDMGALLQEMSHFARAKNEKIAVSVMVAPELKLMGDRDKITQVFLNLINNAIDAAKSSMEISAGKADGGKVEIRVSDDGSGIKKEHMGRLFDPFFTTKKGGTGLGLAICKKIVEDHEGTIELVSSPSRGTTVMLTFRG